MTRSGIELGEVVGDRYRVLQRLGSGAMADVYEVEHVQLGRRFALKCLRPELADDVPLRERFEREARAVARLNSEHIVAIVDCGHTAQGAPYFVMERLHGRELRKLLETEGALPTARALRLAIDVCSALAVAHAAGVVHRDLKPENLFIVPHADGEDLCKVLDFGVAKLAGENPTLPGTLVGTARYMAPEQISATSDVGPATDVFALGVILFECLTGRPPFDADSFERLLYKILNDAPPSLSEQLPGGLASLVQRMLAKSPAERPTSASEVARALKVFTRETRAVSNEQTLYEAEVAVHAPAERRTSGARAGVLAVMFVLGLSVGLLAGRRRSPSPREEASSVEATRTVSSPQLSGSPLVPAAPATATGVSRSSEPRNLRPSTGVAAPRPSTHASAALVEPEKSAKPPLFYPGEPKR